MAELGPRRGGAAELARLAAYFSFADTLQRFRTLKNTPGVHGAQLAALAGILDSGLDERLQRLEVSGAEARAIKLQVLDVLVDDADARRAAWQAWMASAAPGPEAAAARASDAEFLRRQSAVVAAWAAQAPAARDRHLLERDLAALKAASFGNKSASPAVAGFPNQE